MRRSCEVFREVLYFIRKRPALLSQVALRESPELVYVHAGVCGTRGNVGIVSVEGCLSHARPPRPQLGPHCMLSPTESRTLSLRTVMWSGGSGESMDEGDEGDESSSGSESDIDDDYVPPSVRNTALPYNFVVGNVPRWVGTEALSPILEEHSLPPLQPFPVMWHKNGVTRVGVKKPDFSAPLPAREHRAWQSFPWVGPNALSLDGAVALVPPSRLLEVQKSFDAAKQRFYENMTTTMVAPRRTGRKTIGAPFLFMALAHIGGKEAVAWRTENAMLQRGRSEGNVACWKCGSTAGARETRFAPAAMLVGAADDEELSLDDCCMCTRCFHRFHRYFYPLLRETFPRVPVFQTCAEDCATNYIVELLGAYTFVELEKLTRKIVHSLAGLLRRGGVAK